MRKAGTALVVAGGLSQVVGLGAGATSSGSVELSTVATVPTNTTIQITIYEDTDGDGVADNQQTKSIPDGAATTVFDLLTATVGSGAILWLEVELSTSDSSVTPSLDSATVTLPDEDAAPQEPIEPDEPQGLGQLWNNPKAFVAAVVIAYAGIGLWSKSLTLAAWSGYLAFLYIAFTASIPVFEGIAMVTLVLVFLGFAFKLVRLEFGDER